MGYLSRQTIGRPYQDVIEKIRDHFLVLLEISIFLCVPQNQLTVISL